LAIKVGVIITRLRDRGRRGGRRFVSAEKGRPTVGAIEENAGTLVLSAEPRETAAAGLREIRSELRREFRLSAEEPITRLIVEFEDTSPKNAATPNVIRLTIEKRDAEIQKDVVF
jgi:hypothetical protein